MQIEIERVLCPVDVSDCSRRALVNAIAFARWYGAEVTVLHVVPPAMPITTAPEVAAVPVTRSMLDETTALGELVEAVVSGVGARPRVTSVVTTGPVVDEILTAASARRADLIVLGTHGRRGVERLLLGSVAEHVLRRAPCPVLTVPPHLAEGAEDKATFKHIVCALDFSEASLAGLEYALALARVSDASVMLLHAIEEVSDQPIVPSSFGVPEYVALRKEDASRRLASLIPSGAGDWCTAETAIGTGRASREILRVAEDMEADLIVMGVVGRSRVSVLMFGSTTHQVVQGARCPVLTVRSPSA